MSDEKPLPPDVLKRILAVQNEYLCAEMPWELEREARKKAEAEAAGRDLSGYRRNSALKAAQGELMKLGPE